MSACGSPVTAGTALEAADDRSTVAMRDRQQSSVERNAGVEGAHVGGVSVAMMMCVGWWSTTYRLPAWELSETMRADSYLTREGGLTTTSYLSRLEVQGNKTGNKTGLRASNAKQQGSRSLASEAPQRGSTTNKCQNAYRL
jgi:hypothetical protein